MSSRTKKANQAKRLNDLRFVIEVFLASEKFECPSNEDEIKACWERLDEIFSRSSDSVSEAGWEDKENANYVQGLEYYFKTLKLLVISLFDNLFEFKNEVLPRRKMKANFQNSVQNDSPIPHEFNELISANDNCIIEKEYKIGFLVSFESGNIHFPSNSVHILSNFIKLTEGIPLKYFGKCKHCKKITIAVRGGRKEFCNTNCHDKYNNATKSAKNKEKKKNKELTIILDNSQ